MSQNNIDVGAVVWLQQSRQKRRILGDHYVTMICPDLAGRAGPAHGGEVMKIMDTTA